MSECFNDFEMLKKIKLWNPLKIILSCEKSKQILIYVAQQFFYFPIPQLLEENYVKCIFYTQECSF